MKDLDNILVIDTVGEAAMVALNGEVVVWEAKRNHSDQLLENVDRLLTSQGITPQKLKGVVVGVGPSTSFTGVRVGITVANGIGFGLKIPVAAVTEFDLVQTLYDSDWTVVDAKRDEVFWNYKKERGLMPASKLATSINKGESIHMPANLTQSAFGSLQKAGTIYIYEMTSAERAGAFLRSGRLPKEYRQVLPVYLREATITKSKKKSR